MVRDAETNVLYVADILKRKLPDFFEAFSNQCKEQEIDLKLLAGTKGIWVRDFMPIQLSTDQFVRFQYNPDYLQTKAGQKTISDPAAICKNIGIESESSDVLLDGGNIVKGKDQVIICDKVFSENPGFKRKELIRKLHSALLVENIYFVPQAPGDFTGHADGMVRFLDDRTVLINDYSKEKGNFNRSFMTAIHNMGLEYVSIPYNPFGNKSLSWANGIYINYLEMRDVLMLPVYGLREDELALKQFQSLFGGKKILTINCNELARLGGVLNCVSWNILAE